MEMNRLSAARRLAASAAFLLPAACTPAMAEEPPRPFCLARKIMLSTLIEGGRQHLAGQGTTPRGDLFEVYTSEENGTWTLIVTRPGAGLSCVAASGREAWESMKGAGL